MTAARRRRSWFAGLGLVASLSAGPTLAAQLCLDPPYTGDPAELSSLAGRALQALADYPSLLAVLQSEAPRLCLDDSLFEEQGYFEPVSRRIVLRQGLDPALQLAILLHEVRHLEQYARSVCPTVALRLTDYVRSRQALEADASAISLLIAWNLRAAGDDAPWTALAGWPTHGDLAASFGAEMAASDDTARATAAAYAAWFDDPERRELYAYVSCVNYLDALDKTKMPPGKATIDAGFLQALCRLPDGRPYECALPP